MYPNPYPYMPPYFAPYPPFMPNFGPQHQNHTQVLPPKTSENLNSPIARRTDVATSESSQERPASIKFISAQDLIRRGQEEPTRPSLDSVPPN